MNKLTLTHCLKLITFMGWSLMSTALYAQNDLSSIELSQFRPQGGPAPKDARDPHAYAAGTTLTEGAYALDSEERLTLADEHKFYSLRGDFLEYNQQTDSGVFDLQGWFGSTYDRLVIKTEGQFDLDGQEENQTDILWGHAISTYWDTQIGARFDYTKTGASRQWLAFGLQGLAPYWFELDMTAYLGEQGNTAFTFEAEYDLLVTQKLIMQPRVEFTMYGKDDEENQLGKGLSSSALGFRVRYEFTRQFAPYIGVEWRNEYGNTADFSAANEQSKSGNLFVAGIKFWF